jgi:hypothetical protein
MATFFFVVFFVIAAAYVGAPKRDVRYMLMLSCFVVAVLTGFRDPNAWPDAGGYMANFLYNTKTLTTFSFLDRPYGFSEFGFHFLGIIVKTFTGNGTIYFLFISFLTFLFIYLSLEKYGFYPLIGLAVYMGRFLIGRNYCQIRAGLAIAIIIYGTKYITEQKLWKFLLVVLIAYQFHHSAIIALPVYFMNKVKIKHWHIYVGIGIAFIAAAFFGGAIKNFVQGSDYINDMASSYVKEGSDKAYGQTLANPMIYYQVFILFVFTYLEDKLKKLTEHYYTIRNAYFVSCILLIVLVQYAILAGRTSTVFATYEMIMIPMLVLLFKKIDRAFPIFLIGVVSTIFFYLNYN